MCAGSRMRDSGCVGCVAVCMAKRKSARVGNYPQKSILGRIEAFFLDNIGRVVTRAQILEVAKDPHTGVVDANQQALNVEYPISHPAKIAVTEEVILLVHVDRSRDNVLE